MTDININDMSDDEIQNYWNNLLNDEIEVDQKAIGEHIKNYESEVDDEK